MMKRKTKFREWFAIAIHSEDMKALKLEELTRPMKVAGRRTPENLNEMTVGQMAELSTLKDGAEMFYKVCGVLLGMTPKQVDSAKAVDVVRFVGWVLGQIKCINNLFDKAKLVPTQQERKAGIEHLNFGVFGMVDWYAKRMGISDHDKVMDVSWMRLYKCLDMDNKTTMFNRKLTKVYESESKHRRKN